MLGTLLSLCLAACGGGGGAAAPAAAGGLAAPGLPLATSPQTGGTASVSAGTSVNGQTAFSFELPAARTTSAGVYGADGSLVRTLWRGERLAAGGHSRHWDQRRDDGSLAPAGAYTVRLIHHDIQYRWNGVVGNTSTNGAEVPHRAFLPPQTLALVADTLYYGTGYNEGQSAIQAFQLSQPQRPAGRVTHKDAFVGIGLLASDGTRLYAANTGGLSSTGFVWAFELASGAQAAFGEGAALCLNRMADGVSCYADQSYRSVIAQRPAGDPMPSGLAVQKDGPVLAVAYGSENLLRFFDKTSGRALGQLSVPLAAHSRNHLAMSADGDLWVVSAGSLLRITGLGTQPRVRLTISGLDKPLAVAADPSDEQVVWVADGGASQQLKRFGRDGKPMLTLGQRGGMASDARVAPDRFCFALEAEREHSALAIDAQGRPWLVDSCNNRLLHLGSDGQLLEQMAYLPHVYASAVDGGRPGRVFANFMEFEVDYSRELAAPGAWRLVRNWLPVLPAAVRDRDSRNTSFGGFRDVQTLDNGRSYALLEADRRQAIVELTSAGTVRLVSWLRAAAANQTGFVLHPGGELGYAADEAGRQLVYRLPLKGFDSAGNPMWSSQPRMLASVPQAPTAPLHRMGTFTGIGAPRFPVTASGQVVFFDAGVEGPERFHLGAVAQGGTQWAWQASRSGPLDGRGNFQTRSSDSRIQYGGNVALASGRNVVYGYHGEFYTDLGNGRVGQANQFMHFFDNGLFVGQFGVPSTRDGPAVVAGRSGNAFSPSLVRAEGRVYLYHNDESTWGGLHRWELQGADTITEVSASGDLGSSLRLR